MRIVYTGGTKCNYQTLKRLVLIADEIGFMDRPSVTFGDWGTIGMPSEFRRVDTSKSSIKFSFHGLPSGPADELYKAYIAADLGNPRFVQAFFEGLRSDPTFQVRFIQLKANYHSGTGSEILQSLIADPEILNVDFNELRNTHLMFRTDTVNGRRETLWTMLIEASILLTNALRVAEESKLIPVSDDPFFCRLLAMRMHDPKYIGEKPHFAPLLGLAIAKSVLPDQLLLEVEIQDIFDYRSAAKDAYAAWTTEIDKLGVRLMDIDPEKAEREIQKIIFSEVKPKLVEYRNEMKATRDKLFGDLIKKVTTWEMPTLSVAYLASLDIASAFAFFAAALAPALPPVVDYFTNRRDIKRRNSMAYLIGVAKEEPDEN